MIVIAPQYQIGFVEDAPHAQTGLRPVSDHIAQADQHVVGLRQDRLERGIIPVDITDNKNAHNTSIRQ
jgi:hypothetical protein